jgi:hypothetical protein
MLCLAAAKPVCAAETNRETVSPGMSAQEVLKTLESCPAWSDANAGTNEILTRLIPLSKQDTAVLRASVDQFVAKCHSENRYDIGNMSKLFVLNRVLFAVPAKEKFSGPFFGGWEGVPHDEREMNMMWPMSQSNDGELQLTGKYSGYSGDRYLAVQEFDHFLAKYGRRQMRTTKTSKLK